jgi:hypothetical protein
MAGWCFGAPDQQSGLGLIARTPLQLARTAVVRGTVRSSVHLLWVMAT